tara:strand:+ start:1040 stop:1426 length:387 start_codon:yes stop_codon:yes gene_type:complete
MNLLNLKSGQDFISPVDLNNLKINQIVLAKSSVATGWASVVKVVRIMKTQIEVEIINVIPTIDNFKWGVKNPFENRCQGFFQFWAERKKILKGKKRKFFIENNVEVGSSDNWNPNRIAIFTGFSIINS